MEPVKPARMVIIWVEASTVLNICIPLNSSRDTMEDTTKELPSLSAIISEIQIHKFNLLKSS